MKTDDCTLFSFLLFHKDDSFLYLFQRRRLVAGLLSKRLSCLNGCLHNPLSFAFRYFSKLHITSLLLFFFRLSLERRSLSAQGTFAFCFVSMFLFSLEQFSQPTDTLVSFLNYFFFERQLEGKRANQ